MRAAKQRFLSAEILYRNDAYYDSMYMAGYVVEIALKALVLAQIPLTKRKPFIENHFRGAGAHNLDRLWHLVIRHGVTLPVAIAEHLQRIRTWTPDLRYDVGRGSPDDADAYLNSAVEILAWVERSVS